MSFTLGKVEELDNDKRTVLYRVAQEAITNVARHAQASRVEVRLHKLQDAIFMEIKDNGRSFQAERVLIAAQHKRLGLLCMRERVEMVGGTLTVESEPGQGTLIRAEIPFTNGITG
jgi:signal transduction histidine kinase